MSDEERGKIELEFQYALDNIVSKIKGETATAIVYSEQSMILLFKKLMFKIEKQSKEIEELNSDLEVFRRALTDIEVVYNKNYTSNDKIKAKIEECENKIKKIRNKKLINEPEDTIVITRYSHYISVLQSLLEKE